MGGNKKAKRKVHTVSFTQILNTKYKKKKKERKCGTSGTSAENNHTKHGEQRFS